VENARYLDPVLARLEALKIVAPDELKPCTEAEVRKLEARLDLVLPAAYRAFLLLMGHGIGDVMCGTSYRYCGLLDLQEWGIELLEENSFPEPLPADAFVF
jgi:hypothetical protein